jgi:hypothetical protein
MWQRITVPVEVKKRNGDGAHPLTFHSLLAHPQFPAQEQEERSYGREN